MVPAAAGVVVDLAVAAGEALVAASAAAVILAVAVPAAVGSRATTESRAVATELTLEAGGKAQLCELSVGPGRYHSRFCS